MVKIFCPAFERAIWSDTLTDRHTSQDATTAQLSSNKTYDIFLVFIYQLRTFFFVKFFLEFRMKLIELVFIILKEILDFFTPYEIALY